MLLKIISYIKGYIKVSVKGGFPERFLNLCAAADRDIWQVKTEKEGISFFSDIREYKNLRSSAKRTGVKMRVTEKHGLPFLLRRYRYRWGLLAGAAIFCALLYFLSGSVWTVTVSGNKKITEEQIIDMLREAGIREGTRINSLDEENTAQQIILKHPELSWLSINPMGTTLYVDVKERVYAPEVKPTQPQNIIAMCDGVITSVRANSGDALVKEGDAVTKGQVLISGIVTFKDGTTVFKAADGEVTAQVSGHVRVTENFETTQKVRTGKSKTRRIFHFFGLDIPLYITGEYESCEKQTGYTPLIIAGKKLPIGVYKTYLYQTADVTFTRDETATVEAAAKRAQETIDQMSQQTNLISREDSVKSLENGVELTVNYVCEQNIGEIQKIDTNN